MNETALTALQYYGAVAAAIAALLVSLDLGRKWTGYAMVIFVTSSLALIAWGFLQPESEGIGVQNVVLLVINAVGVWRYLLSPHRKEMSGSGTNDAKERAPAA
ncbi:hypothetical protein KRR38_29240 [Novosphingobium sp. G106]|uniref:hypothetical protein n=1 Tax=Novosphingobium sp. G106 TaxID=2849500 RepID=UPI001C2DC3D0|nr:hypothetical protein [Novosphingobium sp. G106]MBV1691651.1 hypothetical protein [Novosphingobium sp. G106]